MAVVYTAAVIGKRRELPESISSMVYDLPKRWQYLWTVWLWLVGLGVCIPLIEILPETWKFVGFLTMACIGFVGAMPLFVEEQRKAHNIFGVSAGILSQVCVLIVNPWWLTAWVLFPLSYILGSRGKEVFIAEVICSATVYGVTALFIPFGW